MSEVARPAPQSDAIVKTRKAPHCTKCKQPMKGHSRSTCPAQQEVVTARAASPALINAKSERKALKPASEELKMPRKPLQAKLTANGKTISSGRPSEGLQVTVPPAPKPSGLPPAKFLVWDDSKSTPKSKPRQPQPHSPPVTPTSASSSPRSEFVGELADSAGVSIHLVSKKDAPAKVKEAKELQLIAHLIHDGLGSGGDDEAMLIVGRCQFAVDNVLRRMGRYESPRRKKQEEVSPVAPQKPATRAQSAKMPVLKAPPGSNY